MRCWLGLLLGLSAVVWAQQSSTPPANPAQSGSTPANSTPGGDSTKQARPPNLAPPRSDRVNVTDLGADLGQSSSKDDQPDLDAPENDAKTHPQSSAAVAEAAATTGNSGITEFHTWDP